MATRPTDAPCPRCGGATMPGVLRDSFGLTGSRAEAQTWLPRVRSGGAGLARAAAKRAARELAVEVVAMRCVDCGHIELFAPK